MTSRLFVYGTLAPGRPDEHVLAGDGYERVLTSVRVAEGRVEDAYVYVLPGARTHRTTTARCEHSSTRDRRATVR